MSGLRARWQPRLRTRLTLVLGGTFLLAGIVLVAVMYLLVQQRLEPSARTVVRVESSRTEAGPAAEDGGAWSTETPGPATGPVTGGVTGEPPAPGPGAADTLVPGDIRVFAGEVERAITDYNKETLTALLRWSLLALLVLLVAAAGAGWLIAGRTLRPLAEITATARRVADRNLHERIALGGPRDELRTLADTFDEMLERLDRAFDGQRRFVANASHELRTPLAVNRTLLEVALGDPDAPEETRRLGRTLLTTNERSERLIDGLLTLAASDTVLARRDPVDLADVAARCVEGAAAEARERGITVSTALGAAPATGDGVLLERLVTNLVENGVRHNVPGGDVVVRTSAAEGGGARVAVTNTGPVVPAYEAEAIFEPFRRLTAERTGSDRGVGLGLAIVRSIARAHGGTAVAVPEEGGGLTVTVTLPAPVPDAAEA